MVYFVNRFTELAVIRIGIGKSKRIGTTEGGKTLFKTTINESEFLNTGGRVTMNRS